MHQLSNALSLNSLPIPKRNSFVFSNFLDFCANFDSSLSITTSITVLRRSLDPGTQRLVSSLIRMSSKIECENEHFPLLTYWFAFSDIPQFLLHYSAYSYKSPSNLICNYVSMNLSHQPSGFTGAPPPHQSLTVLAYKKFPLSVMLEPFHFLTYMIVNY